MKKKRNYALQLCLLLSFGGCSNDDDGYQHKQTQIQEIVHSYNQNYKEEMKISENDTALEIGIGLYVIDGDREFYISDGFPESYKEDIHFRIASNSKTFTAAAILRLHEEGKLNIDDVITDLIPNTNQPYIPNTPNFNLPYKEQITIKQLLQHRAGVFDVTNDSIPATVNAPYAGEFYVDYQKDQEGANHTFSFEELISVVALHQLSYTPPNVTFHYSNTGYNVLGYIIENVSGMPLHQYLETNFFTPLALESTTSPHLGSDNTLPIPATNSFIKSRNNENEIYIEEVFSDNSTANISEGQIISTPKSLAKWAKALLSTNKVLQPETLNMMLDALPADASHGYYGLGIQAFPLELGYGHDGAHNAYLSTMRYEPQSDRTFVIFTNHLNVLNFEHQALDLYQILTETIAVLNAPNE